MPLSDLSNADLMAALGGAPAPVPQPDAPRGIRNNNPLNLKTQGTAGQDGQFAVYNTPEEGRAAADANLIAYHQKHGINTVAGVVNRWAPPSENDTPAYVSHVSQQLGVDPDAPLDMESPVVRSKLLDAMQTHETPGAQTGPQNLSNADLMAAIGQQPDAPSSAPPPPSYTGKGISVEVGGPGPTGPGWTVQPNGLPQTDAKPSVSADVAQALPAGAARAGTSLVDTILQASPVGAVSQMLRTAAALGSGHLPETKPFNGMSQAVDPHLYVPQTTPGRYAETVGEMLPNAAAPGGLARKAAAVVLPAIGAQAAGDVAQHFGANPTVTGVARFLGGVGGGLATGLGVRPAQVGAEAQTLEQVKAAKQAAYQAAENSGATVKPSDAKGLVRTIDQLVQDKGGADLYPTAARMVTRLKGLVAKGVTPTQLDDYRSQVYDQLMADGGKEATIGKAIRGHIDSVLDSDPSWASARDLNARYMKMKEVSDRIDSAGLRASSTYSGGNYANAVRQQIRPLVDPKSAGRIRNLTPDEQAAARVVVDGTPIQNLVRHVSKTLNNKFFQAALAWPTHGVAPMMMEAAGTGLRKAGEAQTEASVQKLIELMSMGGKAEQRAALQYQLGPMEPFNAGTLLSLTRPEAYPAPAPRR